MADSILAIGKIESVKGPSKAVQAFRRYVEHQNPQGIPTDRGYFESLMKLEKGPIAKVETAEAIQQRPSLMDEVGKINKQVEAHGKTTSVDLITRAKEAVAKIDELKAQLNTPELELKAGVQKLLKGKLATVNENLKVAFSKAGIEYIPPERQFGTRNPVNQFLNYLADGQGKLETLGSTVQGMALAGEEFSHAQMLTIQMKVNHVQQELEFFTGLLNKALESTKTVMNVQV